MIMGALTDTRVVFVAGPRQSGKSTLVREIAATGHPARLLTLDDDATLRAARADPTGFLAGFDAPLAIDEVQRAPDLLLAIKARVDLDPRPGRYLLTGSASVFDSRRVPDALTGRVDTVRLWPLSQAEIEGSGANIVDALFAGAVPWIDGAPVGRAAFAEVVAMGGFPEARLRPPGRRERWFANYVADTVSRDMRELSDALRLHEMPRLLRLLASQAAGEVVYRNLARRLDMSHETVKAYIELLEMVFLVRTLPAWRPGLGTREVHAPKAYLVDSGLLAHLLAADDSRIAGDDQVTGRILESFVAMEVARLADCADVSVVVHHYRNGRDEVDLVLEARSGDIAAIEVKAAATVRPRDHAPMARLRDQAGERFVAGIVLYTGAQTLPLGDRIWAMPVSGLWTT
jgi:predicted AAA+ superfamily ATPase